MEAKKKLAKVQRVDYANGGQAREEGAREERETNRGQGELQERKLQEKERSELDTSDELQVGSIEQGFERIARREDNREKKREGRKERSKKEGTNLAGLKLQLLNLHFTLALVTGFNELVLTDEEAEMLAIAVDGFIQEFGITFTSKVAVAVNLAVTMLTIYVPRVFMILERKKKGEN